MEKRMSNSQTMCRILDEIEIPNAGAVRGNITLPASVGGATVTWVSSNPDVITDRDNGALRAGVVTRGDSDCKVTLTATVSLDGAVAEKSIEVCVRKAPEPITEDDYAGYLFGHFIGEENENSEQIYFAVSRDGLHFKDMNNGNPVLVSTVGERGVRDPYLYRSAEGDRYFLIATDLSIYHRGGWFQNEQGYYDASTTGSSCLVLWESEDLVQWGEPKLLPVAPANAGMAWAPEMIYYEKTGEYIIFFSSSIMNPETKYKTKPNAIYYVTTRDFVHFSETGLLIDNQTDNERDGNRREIIDTTILQIGDIYYSASKDGDNAEANGGIRIMRSRDPLDAKSWEKVLDLDELGLEVSGLGIRTLDNSTLEGPELFRYNKRDWADPNVPEYGLMADQYAIGAGYLPLKTTDPEDVRNERNSWKILAPEQYSFDRLKKRHGTIFCITEQELKRLEREFA